jgi:hypothetical protein
MSCVSDKLKFKEQIMEDKFNSSMGNQGDGTAPNNGDIQYDSPGTFIGEMDKNPNSVDQKTEKGKSGKD